MFSDDLFLVEDDKNNRESTDSSSSLSRALFNKLVALSCPNPLYLLLATVYPTFSRWAETLYKKVV